MNIQGIGSELRTFIARYYRADLLKDEDDIFAIGFVNSLFAMQLVLFMEKTFNFKVENTDLDLNNFRSIAAMTQFIERKSAQATPKEEKK